MATNRYGKDGNISVETFCKRRGGKEYRNVRVFVKGTCIDFGDYQVATDEKAINKATKALQDAVVVMNDFSIYQKFND